ncbi:hypothetical protein CRG98_035504 [Punica granatum]|uniref:Uncharacterized protein n=1 Tax=Punica granatum TaxID=22663 RepID=A0A2I0IJG3_PUNGR|nr:hypothetical protein CRG98_035504 [Punica granatum]
MRGRSPKVGQKPDEGPEPDVRPKPNAVNVGREPDAGKCMLDKKVQEMQKQRSMLGNSAERCKAVTLICLRIALWSKDGDLVLKSQGAG